MEQFAIPGVGGIIEKEIDGVKKYLCKHASNLMRHAKMDLWKYPPEKFVHLRAYLIRLKEK